jgi:NAD(P)-dependent dehydrogenase (short-subunit alcohol dehydrogenase family)
MMLTNKNAVIYGAGDSLGGAVGLGLAEAGATVYLTSRHLSNAAKIADRIVAAGGRAEAAEVDALDEDAVKRHAEGIVRTAGTLDISFNLINIGDTQGIALADMSAADFVRPVHTAMLTQFLTTTAAARLMCRQRSGTILSLTATPGGIGYPLVGGFGPACAAIEAYSTNLAAELGPHGIRVVNIRSAGSPDSRPFRDAIAQGGEQARDFVAKLKDDTMLKELPLMRDIANTAVFLASDLAAKITGVTVDVTAGTTSALNYTMPPVAFE